MLQVHALAGGHAAVLLPGEELTRGAADLVAVAASTMPADAWFGDHELLDDHGAVVARSYVPEWSPEYLRHTDIVNGAVVLRPELVPLLDDLTASSARVRRHELLLKMGLETVDQDGLASQEREIVEELEALFQKVEFGRRVNAPRLEVHDRLVMF